MGRMVISLMINEALGLTALFQSGLKLGRLSQAND